jgi:4-diphosphocytidyl-2-C-methyl-D-erythritol kinase
VEETGGVRVVAPAKLTLSLRVTGVRADGYHLIDAEMVSVDLCDTLTFAEGDGLTLTGIEIPSDGDNLVTRALRAVGRSAHVTLDKQIPAGAGLGGGSSDAAAVLRWAGVADLALAASLGGDVPFCVRGGRAQVSGIGEIVEPLPFVARTFTLLTPPLHVSTPAVYRTWDELGGPRADGPNDLEPAALAVCPDLARYRDQLGDATGQTPVLAGSGATWFVAGEFRDAGRVVSTLPTSPPGDPARPTT